jgi:hypothetical protein
MDAILEGMETLTLPLLHLEKGYTSHHQMHPCRSLRDMAAIYGQAIVLVETTRDTPGSHPNTASMPQHLATPSRSKLSHTTHPCPMYRLLGPAGNQMVQLSTGVNLYIPVLGNHTVQLLSTSQQPMLRHHLDTAPNHAFMGHFEKNVATPKSYSTRNSPRRIRKTKPKNGPSNCHQILQERGRPITTPSLPTSLQPLP